MVDRGMLDYVMARVRPQIQADGGDVVVTEIDDEKGIVYVALKGACIDCPLSALTLSQGVERVLVEHVPGVTRVLPDMEETEVMKNLVNGVGMEGQDGEEAIESEERFGDPVRVTRVDEEGNITEGTL